MIEHLQQYYQNPLILASQSPRRAHLLNLVGFEFKVLPSHLDESLIQEADPAQHVLKLSEAKARDVAKRVDKGAIIGADTIVVLDGMVLGKPAHAQEAFEMLRMLAGKSHQVYTGFCIVEKPGMRIISDYEITTVRFRYLQDWEIKNYVNTQKPLDKAGAYGIQDQSAVFVDRIEGCFYNVVGFPLAKFYTTFSNFVKLNQELD